MSIPLYQPRNAHARDPRLFEALFEAALDAVFIAGDDRRYVDVNRAACDMLGIHREQLIGRPVDDYFEIESQHDVPEAWKSFRQEGLQMGTCRFRRSDGQIRFADFRAKANFWPGLHVSFLRDVTDQRTVEAALRESNRQLTLLAGATTRLLAADQPRALIADLFRELSAELGLEIYFNYLVSADGKLHLDSYTGVLPSVAAELESIEFGQAVCGRTALTGQALAVENVQSSSEPMTQLIRDIGIEAYVCNPLLHGTQVIGTLSFGTRRRSRFKPSELQLMKAVADNVAMSLQRSRLTAEIESKNAELEQYAFAASHDLQEPLRMMKIYTELLRRQYAATFDATASEYLHFMETGTGRMSALVRDLLLYSRMTMAEDEREPSPVDMNLVVDTALANLKAAVDESHARITVEPLPPAYGRFDDFVTVMQNLVSNAIKYAKPGLPPEVTISGTIANGVHEYVVKDAGQGIAPQYHERVFDVFKRLHGDEVAGTGIGLSLCKRIVEKRGGRIWVESDRAQGATFRFTLPAQSTAATPSHA